MTEDWACIRTRVRRGRDYLRAGHVSCNKCPSTGEHHDPDSEQIPLNHDPRGAPCLRGGDDTCRGYRAQRRRIHDRDSDVAELRRARSRVGGGARRRIRRARLRRDAPGQQGRARRPFHSAHGLDRQGDGGPDAREHGGRRHGEARRPARQIRAVRRQGAGIRGARDYAPRSRDLYGRPATRTAGRAGPAAGAESVHGLPSGRLLALARAGKVALCAGLGRDVFQSRLRPARRGACQSGRQILCRAARRARGNATGHG